MTSAVAKLVGKCFLRLVKSSKVKKYLAELIGTFALVINDVSVGAVSHLGIAITFGLIVTVMIYSFGPISGAHINPAVSIAFAFTDRYERKELIPYMIAQVVGAILASTFLIFLFWEHETLGLTAPSGSWQQSFLLEILLTYFLMLVILFVSQNKETSQYTAIAVGATVLLEALFAGPISGASMNPARSVGPALLSGNLSALWIYILAPVVGAILASYTWMFFEKSE